MSEAIAELLEKRAALAARQEEIRTEIARLGEDLAARDRVLSLLDPSYRPSAPAKRRTKTSERHFGRGELSDATLERICVRTGYPKTIRAAEFISRDMDPWAYRHSVALDVSRPERPADNALIEAFNAQLRAECLNAHGFLSLADAAETLEAWRRDYNEQRPHGAIGNKVPAALMKSAHAASPCC